MPTATATDGTPIAYDVDGDGPLLLFVHGITEERHRWDPVVERLRADFTCARLDVRGHGESVPPAGFALDAVVGDLATVVAATGAPDAPVMVGHSMGGFLATAYAATAAGPLRAVVNVDQSLRMTDLAQVVRPLEAGLRGPQFPQVFGAITTALGVDRLDAATRQDVLRLGDRDQEVVLAMWQTLFESTDEEIEALLSALLPNIGVPYLALHGADPGDGYVDWLTGFVPTATVEVWDGDGHWLHLVEPDRFTERIRAFVAGLPR